MNHEDSDFEFAGRVARKFDRSQKSNVLTKKKEIKKDPHVLQDQYGLQAEYWQVYKNLVRYFGLEPALLLAELLGKQRYYASTGKLDEKGYFYHLRAYIEQELFLTPARQRAITKILNEYQALDVKSSGGPAKNYYRVNEEVLQSICELDPLDLYKSWKENNIKSIEKKLQGRRHVAPKKRRIIKLPQKS